MKRARVKQELVTREGELEQLGDMQREAILDWLYAPGESLRAFDEESEREITTAAIFHNKLLLNNSVKLGRIRFLTLKNLVFGNCASTLFCKSFEFLPDLEKLAITNVTAEGKWFAKLAGGLNQKQKTSGKVAILRLRDSRSRVPAKEIRSLASIFKNGCSKSVNIRVGCHLSSIKRLLIKQAMAQGKIDDVKFISVLATNSNLYFDSNTVDHRNGFPHEYVRQNEEH